MNEQMIEKVADTIAASHQYYAPAAGDSAPRWADCLARAAIETIMPVVDSVDALIALPVGTKLLDGDGNVWWPVEGQPGWLWSTNDDYAREGVQVLADYGPLRVIWTPEAIK
jgi:hypothetical protein